jgi:hypothetical protein
MWGLSSGPQLRQTGQLPSPPPAPVEFLQLSIKQQPVSRFQYLQFEPMFRVCIAEVGIAAFRIESSGGGVASFFGQGSVVCEACECAIALF